MSVFYPWGPVAFDPWGGAGLAYGGPHGTRQSRAAPAWAGPVLVVPSAQRKHQQAPRQRRRSTVPYGEASHEDDWETDEDLWDEDDLQMLYDDPGMYSAYEQQRGPRRQSKQPGMGVSLIPQYADAAEGSPRNRRAKRRAAAAAEAQRQHLLQQQQNQAVEQQLQQRLLQQQQQQQQQQAWQQALQARQQQQMRQKQQPPMRPVQQQAPLPLRPEPLTAATAATRAAAPPAGSAPHVPLTPPARQQHGVPRRVPVTAPAPVAPQPAAPQVAPTHQAPPATTAAAPAAPARPRAQGAGQRRGLAMSKSQAARVIQTQWRMARLARHKEVLKKLATANHALRDLEQLLSTRLEASNGHLTHKDFLELSEYATRVLLQLDELSVRPPELRALKKYLTQRALALLDAVQNAYSRGVHASMELSDEEVAKALNRAASVSAPRAVDVTAADVPAAVVDAAADDAANGADQQQQQPQDVCDMEETADEEEWLEQHGDTAAEEVYRSMAHADQDQPSSDLAAGSVESSSIEGEAAAGTGGTHAQAPFTSQQSGEGWGWGRIDENEEEMAPSRDLWAEESLTVPDAAVADATGAGAAGMHGAHDVPPGMRLVWVYPGSRAEAACQTD